jgi:hypothetical protein
MRPILSYSLDTPSIGKYDIDRNIGKSGTKFSQSARFPKPGQDTPGP